jgi:hypothetical protein
MIRSLIRRRLMWNKARLLVLAFAAWCLPVSAHAWGARGHHLVTELAYQRLTPHARAEVNRLLAVGAGDNTTFCPIDSIDSASVWADCVRRRNSPFSYQDRWHYIDIPVCGDIPPPCNNDCVTDAITQADATLKNRRANDHQRLLALARLIHFVADVTQPLHAADNSDRGGNRDKASFLGQTDTVDETGDTRPINLHGVWDYELVDAALGSDDSRARHDIGLIASANPNWANGDAQAWALDAHRIADRFIYTHWPAPLRCNAPASRPIIVDPAYVAAAIPIVRTQLAKAVVRLSAVLNRDLN